ncbi:MAG: hypothetical protein ACR2OJ_17300 [Hyphomicrobiales bacterium]
MRLPFARNNIQIVPVFYLPPPHNASALMPSLIASAPAIKTARTRMRAHTADDFEPFAAMWAQVKFAGKKSC